MKKEVVLLLHIHQNYTLKPQLLNTHNSLEGFSMVLVCGRMINERNEEDVFPILLKLLNFASFTTAHILLCDSDKLNEPLNFQGTIKDFMFWKFFMKF